MQRFVHVILFVGGLVAAAVTFKWLRGAPSPALADDPWPAGEPWPPIEQAPASATAPVAAPASWTATSAAPDQAGACPVGFPIKAKVSSGIYHEPGMLNYDRAFADRCYANGAAAEADGFRRAKR